MKMKHLTLSIFTSLLLLGCGGGGSDGGSKDDGKNNGGGDGGISIGGGNGGGGTGGGNGGGNGGGSSNAKAEIQGRWASPCIPLKDGTTAVIIYQFDKTTQGNEFFAETFGFYETGDCSGGAGTFSLVGPVTYSGTKSTSICVAEKFSSTYVLAVVDGKTMSDDKFKNTKYYNQKFTSLACVYRGDLLLGDGKGGMNAKQAYSPMKSKVLSDPKRLKKSNSDVSIDPDTLKKISEVESILK